MSDTKPTTVQNRVDPAAVYAMASSILEATGDDPSVSEIHGGFDQAMREAMEIATEFEAWATDHVDFDRLTDVWPYMLEEKAGAACQRIKGTARISSLTGCELAIAKELELPLIEHEPPDFRALLESFVADIDAMRHPCPLIGSVEHDEDSTNWFGPFEDAETDSDGTVICWPNLDCLMKEAKFALQNVRKP